MSAACAGHQFRVCEDRRARPRARRRACAALSQHIENASHSVEVTIFGAHDTAINDKSVLRDDKLSLP
jgi:hypothetical protein